MKKLNLGCGSNWKEKYPEYEGLDIVDYGQRYVGDVFEILENLKDDEEYYHEVMANHFLEHFSQEQLKIIFLNVHKILKKDGVFRITVPHMDRPEAWYLVHKTFFNEATFRMFDRVDTDSYAEFGTWKVKSLVTNDRKDIHCELVKV